MAASLPWVTNRELVALRAALFEMSPQDLRRGIDRARITLRTSVIFASYSGVRLAK
jgi:hypothetical protein